MIFSLLLSGLFLMACSTSRTDSNEPTPEQTDTQVAQPDISPDIVINDTVAEPIPNGPLAAAFNTPATPESGLYIEAESLEDEKIRVRIRTAGLTDIFGIAFRLEYDSNLLEVVSAQAPNTLDGDGATSHTVFHQNENHQLIYGGARFHTPGQWGQVQYTGVDLDGAILATVEMALKKEGKGEIQFHVLGRDIRDITLENIDVSWVGTSIDIAYEQEGGTP